MPELEIKKRKEPSLEKLLKENIELNKKIYKSCRKTEKYIFFVKAFGIFKFVVILVPVIIGILYLLPVVGNFLEIYKGLFASIGGDPNVLKTIKTLPGL